MDLDSFYYLEQFRLEVLARAMDGFARLLQIGLNQGDFAGRNVLLVQDESNPLTPATDTSGGLTSAGRSGPGWRRGRMATLGSLVSRPYGGLGWRGRSLGH